MPSKDATKLSISKTSGEWMVIQRRLQELNKKNLSFYIQGEIWKMKSKLTECPDCIAPSNEDVTPIVKRPYIRTSAYDDMMIIALKINVPPSVIVDHIVNGLLKEYPVRI